MANVITAPTFFPRRLSQYVPAMSYASDVSLGTGKRVSFGTPAVAAAAAILSAQSIAVATTLQASGLLLSTIVEPYGRNLTYVASGAATSTVLVDGWDYLGQPTSEQITLNGATPVVGLKAFKYLRQITWGVTAATTINVGIGTKFGLPYKALKVEFETSDNVFAAAGTLTAPDQTDPATVSTGDPRGVYVPTTTPNGSHVITAVFDFANDVNASNNGGLHGIAQFGN